MEIPNTFVRSPQEMIPSETRAESYITEACPKLQRRPSLRANFSYPRLSRQESNESRSSEGSLPGMTDTSDSDLSFEDDWIYNSAAGELWDRFWLDSFASSSSTCRRSQELDIDPLQPEPRKRYSKAHQGDQPHVGAGGDAIRLPSKEHGSERPTTSGHGLQSPSSVSAPKKSTVTYSIYPKPLVIQAPRHPPRNSSLSAEPLSPPPPPPPQSLLRGCRSVAVLRSGKTSQNKNPASIAPSSASSSKLSSSQQRQPPTTSTSAPVSPVYPPPAAPKTLRPTASAFSLRDKARLQLKKKTLTSHNMTAPLAPLLPSALPEPLPNPKRPQPERFISVFEFDSDSETEAHGDGGTFARRIARGLHKKSASEKRVFGERKASATLTADVLDKDPDAKQREADSLRRRRGGSLGRIFGLKGR